MGSRVHPQPFRPREIRPAHIACLPVRRSFIRRVSLEITMVKAGGEGKGKAISNREKGSGSGVRRPPRRAGDGTSDLSAVASLHCLSIRASNKMNRSMSLRGTQRRSNLNPTGGDCFAALAMTGEQSPVAGSQLAVLGSRFSVQEPRSHISRRNVDIYATYRRLKASIYRSAAGSGGAWQRQSTTTNCTNPTNGMGIIWFPFGRVSSLKCQVSSKRGRGAPEIAAPLRSSQ
jgi:hypothetical protein